jgi:hypothetical protein
VPAGYNPVVTDYTKFAKFPVAATPVTPTTVGPALPNSTLCEIIGPIPPVNTLDTSGKYVVVERTTWSMFGAGVTQYYWSPVVAPAVSGSAS